MSERQYDVNGFFEIKKNPISKVGVFPYSGASIGAPDPNKIYMVLRPEEELSSPETLASMRLLPWVDEHDMLGDSEDDNIPLMAAEEKGVEGVTGEDVTYEDKTVFTNLKLFSKALKSAIESGKKELSLGYRCKWDFSPGDYEGEHYDVVQRNIRGNHLALVEEGRMGADVAVQDSKDIFYFALDSKEFIMQDEDKKAEDMEGEVTLETLAAMVEALAGRLSAIEGKKEEVKEEEEVEVEDEFGGKKGDESKSRRDYEEDEYGGNKGDESRSKRDYEGDEKEDEAEDEAVKAVGDSLQDLKASYKKEVIQEIANRDRLANELSLHIGDFATDGMDLEGVTRYGLKKLKLEAEKGQELSTLKGYLKGAGHSEVAYAADSAVTSYESAVEQHYS